MVPSELEHPADGVPDDGAPEVANVHLLGDVRAGEVHHHALRVGDPATTDKTHTHTHTRMVSI